MSHQTPARRLTAGQRMDSFYTGDMSNTTTTTVNKEPPERSIPRAVFMVDHHHAKKQGAQTAGAEIIVDSADVLLCDLGNKAMVVEDLDNALRLWTKPAVLIAGRNSLDGLPSNVPETILFLDLSWNRLTVLKGFAALPNLRELDLSHNGVQDMLGLVGNTDLRVLRIAHNHVRRIEGLQQLKRLEEVDLSHNLLKTTDDVRALSLNGSLRRLRVEGNPFCATGVLHGSYEIAMQHLLPGMALLDGKPQSSPLSVTLPSPLPPPPPTRTSSATAANRVPRGCSPHVASTRDSQAVSNVSGDLSVTRGWRDSAVTRARNTRSLIPAHDKQKGADNPCTGGRGGVARVKASTGGGGPALAPGSYVELFVVAQRKKGFDTTIATAQGSPVAGASPSRGNARGAHNIYDRQSVRGKEATIQAGFHAHTPGDGRRRVAAAAAGAKEGLDDVDGRAGARAAAAHTAGGGGRESAAQSAAPFSLLSNRGLSRAERAAARRLAWSQARQEGAVGTGTSKNQRKEAPPVGALASRVASRTAFHSNTAGGEGGKRRAVGSRSPDHNQTTARERSVARRSQGGAAAAAAGQELQLSSSQVSAAADRRSRRNSGNAAGNVTTFDRDGSGGGGSSTGAPQNPQGRHRRQVGMRSRARDGNAKPGARRPINSSFRQAVGAAPSESTRGSRGCRSGGDTGSEVGKKQDKKSSAPSGGVGGGGGEDAYRYKTTLGQRSRRGPRPLAPHTSPWTPREDAKPWREGEGSSGGRRERNSRRGAAADAGDGVEDDLSGSRNFAPTEATSTSKREKSLTKRGGGRATTKRKGNVVHYQQHRNHHHHGDEYSSSELERFGDDGGGGGGGGSSTRVRPYVSPLSPAGILQRACSARSSGSLSATSTAERFRTTAASSSPRWTETTRNQDSQQEEMHREVWRNGRGRRSGLDAAELADQWQVRPTGGAWKGSNGSDPVQVLYGDEPFDEEREEGQEEAGRIRGRLWEDRPPQAQPCYSPSRVLPTFRKGSARDDDSSEGYQRPPIPLPSELHPSDSVSLGYSERTGTRSTGGSSGGSARGDGHRNGRRSVRDNGAGRAGQTSTRGDRQRQRRAPDQSWTGAPEASKVVAGVPRSLGAEARMRRWNSPTLESPPLDDNNAVEDAMADIRSEPNKRAWPDHRGVVVADHNDQDEWNDEDHERRVSHYRRGRQTAGRSKLPDDTADPVFERATVVDQQQQHMIADDDDDDLLIETTNATSSSKTPHGHDDGRVGDRYDRRACSNTTDEAEETLSQKELLANAGIALEEVRGGRVRGDGGGDGDGETRATRNGLRRLGDGPDEGRGERGGKGTSTGAGSSGSDAAVVGFDNEVVDMLTSMVGGMA